MDIIIKRGTQKGQTRSKVERELADNGWGASLTPEQIDKCEYAEGVIKERFNSDKSFVRSSIIGKVK